jgi:hypothetical protein
VCSNDPICADHEPTSTADDRALQGAACHGCPLIAETSRETRNLFLDRSLLIETMTGQQSGFFVKHRRTARPMETPRSGVAGCRFCWPFSNTARGRGQHRASFRQCGGGPPFYKRGKGPKGPLNIKSTSRSPGGALVGRSRPPTPIVSAPPASKTTPNI